MRAYQSFTRVRAVVAIERQEDGELAVVVTVMN